VVAASIMTAMICIPTTMSVAIPMPIIPIPVRIAAVAIPIPRCAPITAISEVNRRRRYHDRRRPIHRRRGTDHDSRQRRQREAESQVKMNTGLRNRDSSKKNGG
jgi:hypothetical protein